jgi:rhamnose transport system substrate-binding protein
VKNINKQELVLAAFILLEIALFSVTATNFVSVQNLFECMRLSTELGLLGLALTPVIVTGGIDLSVGSMMGLSAVAFGAMWHDWHFPLALALILTLLISVAGGILNASFIARFNASPLIVTLGTYSLFRGLAEGITAATRSYSGFPSGYLFLGQGYLAGVVPAQTVILLIAGIGFYVLLHRGTAGRALYAIGHSAEGARYAAIPVKRRLALAYILCALCAGIAGLVYVAHVGQAKSDAGTGYELLAITIVVLGGTSIFGGSGSILGTLLGLVAIVVLQDGLLLSAWPIELGGILTGFLLVLTIVLERGPSRQKVDAPSNHKIWRKRPLFAGLIVVGFVALCVVFVGNSSRVHRRNKPGSVKETKRFTIAVMPHSKGDPYFISCRIGAEQAAKDLGVDLIWDGPTGVDAAKQNEIVEGWITRHVDAISISVSNGPGISSVLRRAREQGIKVFTWDADAEHDARDYFINQATAHDIAYTLTDEAARVMHERGAVAIITGALTAANQNEWISYIKDRLEKYPHMKLDVIRPSDDDRDKAFAEAQTLLKVYPDVKIIIVISAPAVPGAAEAIKQSGRHDVQVVGLSLPNLCKAYVHSGQIEAVVLWNTADLGYLAVAAPVGLLRGTFHQGSSDFDAGRLGKVKIEGTEIVLGAPLTFRDSNIDKYNF